MSELKVNTITPATTTGIRINSPVGVNTNAPSSGMQISGKLNVIDNNLEVVTVASSNYGIKIKAPTSNNEAILQFSNYDGTPRATISANKTNDLIFRTGGATAAIMSGSGVFKIEQQAQFNKPVTVNGVSQFNATAVFDANHIPRCSGSPVIDQQLVNLGYLKRYIINDTTVKTWSVFGNINNGGLGGCCSYYNGVGNNNAVNSACGAYGVNLPGEWLVVAFSFGVRGCSCFDNEQFHFPVDQSKVWVIDGDNGDTIQNTIVSRGGISNIYNVFGFAIRIV
jgi:hypothetical protein